MNNVRCALSCLVWRCMERKSRRPSRAFSLADKPWTLGGSRRAAPEPGVRSCTVTRATVVVSRDNTRRSYGCGTCTEHCVNCNSHLDKTSASRAPRSPRLQTCSTLAPRLCVARRALRNCDAATLSRRSEGEQLSFPERATLGLCFCATGVLLDHLSGTAAPPATCGSAHARCDWGRGPLS